jgi:pseudo-rSAM protein
MKNMINYWLYLEPYTFIFSGNKEKIIYNTVDGSYLKYTDPDVLQILEELSIPENGYCIPICGESARKRSVVKCIREIRNSFSGDIVSGDHISQDTKPYIFMPALRLYNNVERIKKERGKSLGEMILRNIHEVTCFLPGNCRLKCRHCNSYYKQMNHCSSFSGVGMDTEKYICLFKSLEACGVNHVNIMLNDLSEESAIFSLLDVLSASSFKKIFHLFSGMINEHIEKLFIPNSQIHIFIHPFSHGVQDVKNNMRYYKDYPFSWICPVSSEKEIEWIEKTFTFEKIKFIPFYNGNNLEFLENNLYLTIEDITNMPIEKQQIFRRQALNENFFGKLYILPSGETYSNLNFPPIGNIIDQSLGEIVYNEFNDSKAWLKTRNEGACKECVNKYLCPSISNYELVLNKANLCRIVKI